MEYFQGCNLSKTENVFLLKVSIENNSISHKELSSFATVGRSMYFATPVFR